MTPAARSQAAIELLDEVIAAARDGGPAADTLAARFFAARRYAGSKDKRAIRELVYAAIRRAGERPANGRAALLGLAQDDPALTATFDGSGYGPAPVDGAEPVAEAGVAPAWLCERLAAADLGDDQQAALIGRAPLDLRVNTLRTEPAAVAAGLADAAPIPGLPNGLRLPTGAAIATPAGTVEVQDAGSQLIVAAAAPRPGERVVDLCAGAGGKTLALAAAMENRGELLACDTDRSRLMRLPARAEAAGVTNVVTCLLNPKREAEALTRWVGAADRVLVDAPCSGTGTWRRNPEARWRLTPARLAAVAALQARLLDLAATLVRPGGTLVYAVCSLLDEEGADQAAAFASRSGWPAERPGFGAPRGVGVRLSPASDGTDGFFVARWVRPC